MHDSIDRLAPFYVQLEDAVQERQVHDVTLMETHPSLDLILRKF